MNLIDKDKLLSVIEASKGKLIDFALDAYTKLGIRGMYGEVKDAIDNAPSVEEPHWISVKTGLPDSRETVIAYFDNGDIEMLWQDWKQTFEIWNEYVLEYSCYDEHMELAKRHVTHWMPLPLPPKE